LVERAQHFDAWRHHEPEMDAVALGATRAVLPVVVAGARLGALMDSCAFDRAHRVGDVVRDAGELEHHRNEHRAKQPRQQT